MTDHLKKLLALAPTRDSGRDAYKAILEASEIEFCINGVTHSQARAIIDRSGVSSRTFYNFFPDGIPDVALICYHYRRRRVKHSIRTNLHHIMIRYHLPKLTGDIALPAPILLTIYVIVHSIFKTLREKSELDQDLVTYLVSNHLSLHTSQEGLIVEEVQRALITMSPGLPKTSAFELAMIIVHGTKGVLEGSWVDRTDHQATISLERTLIEMFAHTYARKAGDCCTSCKAMRAVNINALIPSTGLGNAPLAPITSTIPTEHMTLPEEEIRLLLDTPDTRNDDLN
jgi:hypothetical protein